MSEQLPFQNVGKVCGPNPGFVRSLWLVDARQVEHIPDPIWQYGNSSLLVPSRMISFFSDVMVYRMKFRNKECTYQEPPSPSDAGVKYTQSIQFGISQLNLENTSWLFDNVNTRWIAFFQDHLRNTRVAGSTSIPMVMNFGSQLGSENNTTVSLVCESTHPAWFTDSLPALNRVFESGFSDSFS
jgi:hypothetical protein